MFDRLTSVLCASTLLWLAVTQYGHAAQARAPSEDELAAQVRAVNEGELRILLDPPAEATHHHQNRIHITKQSLVDGWVLVEQCHEHLDPVAALQIVYRPERTRGLRILSSKAVAHARVEASSIQLEDIGPGAELCAAFESKALVFDPQGGLHLRTGPYMRRFLDGYYPLQVTIEVSFPADRLHFLGTTPQAQPGVRLGVRPGRVDLDLWLEGRLTARFDFCRKEQPICTARAAETPANP